MGKTEDQVVQLLRDSDPLTLAEISERLGKKPRVVFRALRKLFEEGKVNRDPQTRRYALVKEGPR